MQMKSYQQYSNFKINMQLIAMCSLPPKKVEEQKSHNSSKICQTKMVAQ